MGAGKPLEAQILALIEPRRRSPADDVAPAAGGARPATASLRKRLSDDSLTLVEANTLSLLVKSSSAADKASTHLSTISPILEGGRRSGGGNVDHLDSSQLHQHQAAAAPRPRIYVYDLPPGLLADCCGAPFGLDLARYGRTAGFWGG